MLGIIKGRQIIPNRDGETDKVMLQIEFLPDDVRIVELMTESGEDFNPAIGSRVFVVDETDSYKLAIASTDDLTPECDPGEKEFYSTDDPVTTKKAKIKLNSDSEVVLNDGTDYAVKYNELKTVVEELQNDLTTLKAAFNTWVVNPADGGAALKTAAAAWYGTPISGNMANTKVDKVRI